MRHHAAMSLIPALARNPLDVLLAFRAAVYAAFGARRDALFEVLDALLTSEPGGSPVHLSLTPAHRRGWGSFYAALAEGEIEADTMEGLLAAYAPPLEAGEPALYAVDTSIWARCDAETSPERGFYHHPSRHSNGQPIVAGWSYQWVAQVRLTADSWTVPLSARRVPPGTNMNEVAARQVKTVVAQRPDDGQVPLFAFDAGYDAVQLAEHVAGVPVALVVRLRSGRCFYADPVPKAGTAQARGGRPARHGRKFTCAEPTTWWAPDGEHVEKDAQYGQVRVRAWAGVHAKTQAHRTRGTWALRPLQRGTLLLVEVERLPRQTRSPKPLWLWWQGPAGTPLDLALIWRAYVHRFDVEHTFRFVRQALRWAAVRVRQPAAADRWTWLVVLAYTQLRLARGLIADHYLPWERPQAAGRQTPYRVRRQFRQLCAVLATPAAPPKPSGHSATRPKGLRYRPAPRYPAVKLREADGSRRLLTAA